MEGFILIVVHEGFVRHCALYRGSEAEQQAQADAVAIMAPRLGFHPSGDIDQDFSAVQDRLENFEDDGEHELYVARWSFAADQSRDIVIEGLG